VGLTQYQEIDTFLPYKFEHLRATKPTSVSVFRHVCSPMDMRFLGVYDQCNE
jgi:hypothetical protein